jgi:pSer/pThr/pTyr-binding forkhead associated (FHA) protein
MAKVLVAVKDRTLHEIIVDKDSVTTIGRDPSNGIHLVNPAVSRFHAKLYRQDWEFYIEDLGSSNGTFVNGRKVTCKTGLKRNDKITIAKYMLIFIDDRSDYEELKRDKEDKTVIIEA